MSLLTWLQFLADLRRDRSRIGSAQQAEPEPRPHASWCQWAAGEPWRCTCGARP